MTPQQIRKAERLAAIEDHLKTAGSFLTAGEVHKAIPLLNCGFSTVQEYLRDLVHANKIHCIEASRAGSNGAPKMHYAYGPSQSGHQSLTRQQHHDVGAVCYWLRANEWQRGQHGMDRMVSALFGEVRP